MVEPRPQHANVDVHAVLLPTAEFSLLIPSNMVAEVVMVAELKPLAHTADWVMGYFVWRDRAVPLITFEAMCGGAWPDIRSHFVVFYPLSGRQANDYFAIVVGGNPHSVSVGPSSEIQSIPESVPAGLVGGALKIENSVALIPNFETCGRLFYDNS